MHACGNNPSEFCRNSSFFPQPVPSCNQSTNINAQMKRKPYEKRRRMLSAGIGLLTGSPGLVSGQRPNLRLDLPNFLADRSANPGWPAARPTVQREERWWLVGPSTLLLLLAKPSSGSCARLLLLAPMLQKSAAAFCQSSLRADCRQSHCSCS